MLIVKREREYECSEEIVYLDSSRLYRDCEVIQSQTEGNKDCEAHRCVDF